MSAAADVVTTLRQARKAKGLTQRELGQRVGLPQSHISKIEGGAVDLQLSSLVEVARALDLELKLVPRKALPAIEGAVRAAVGTTGTSAASRALANIQKELRLADQIRASFPNLKEIESYRSVLKNIQTLQIDNQSLKALQNALKPSQDLAKYFKENSEIASVAKRLHVATSALQQWRNIQVHLPQLDSPRQRPAYRLENDE